MDTKKCNRCGVEKSLDAFNKKSESKDGHKTICKECLREERIRVKNEKKEHVEYKYCKFCDQTKHRTEFTKNISQKDGLNYKCKKCTAIDRAKYYSENIEKMRDKCKKWRKNNIQKCKELSKKYQINNADKINRKKKEYYQKNKDKIKLYQKKYREKHRDELLIKQKVWNKNRKNTTYFKDKYNSNDIFKLKTNIRNLINQSISLNGYTKKSRSYEILGCDWDFFKNYIESQFEEGMTWGNHGVNGWHLDHVLSISFAMTEEEVEQLNYYINFQPLWGTENINKSNNVFYSEKTLQKVIDVWL